MKPGRDREAGIVKLIHWRRRRIILITSLTSERGGLIITGRPVCIVNIISQCYSVAALLLSSQ